MRSRVLFLVGVVVLTVLSGCLGKDTKVDPATIDDAVARRLAEMGSMPGATAAEGPWFVPAENITPTGRTIRLRATVLDLLDAPVHPRLEANLWAFCFKAEDPEDADSVAAIDHFGDRAVDVADAAWTGACSVPGPTLRLKQGDRLVVTFQNDHVHPHTIHWHGQHVPNGMDGVPGMTQDPVMPGETFVYDYVAVRSGTLWYHCHVDTQFHVMQGLFGAMVIEPQDTQYEPGGVSRDQILVLSTLRRDLVEATPERKADPHRDHRETGGCGRTGEPGCQNPPVDVTPDTFLMNGVSAPYTLSRNDALIRMEPDETLRLRILNAGTTFETLHTHGHDMLVTHIDGNPLHPTARYWVDTLPIAPAQRMDVLIQGRAGNEGVWAVHSHVVDHVANDRQYPGGMKTAIVYAGYEGDLEPYQVELHGGLPYVPPVRLPPDYENTTRIGIGTTTDPHVRWTFPVEAPCAIRGFRFNFGVETALTVAQLANDLNVSIFHPDGNISVNETIGTDRHWEWDLDPAQARQLLQRGEYTVLVGGRAVESTIEMSVSVDHYDDLAEHREAGSPCAGAELGAFVPSGIHGGH